MELQVSEMPGADELVQAVQTALDKVAELSGPSPEGGWTNAISEEISQQVRGYAGVECAFGRDRRKRADEREWLFDYCALFFEEKTANVRRFVAQALIIGEIEFSDIKGLDTDFEKLLIADSLVCFFVFPSWSNDDANLKLDEFQKLSERRQRYAKNRGMSRPPIFVISCYFYPEKKFIHRVVDS